MCPPRDSSPTDAHQFPGGEDRCAHGWIEHQGDTAGTEMWFTVYHLHNMVTWWLTNHGDPWCFFLMGLDQQKWWVEWDDYPLVMTHSLRTWSHGHLEIVSLPIETGDVPYLCEITKEYLCWNWSWWLFFPTLNLRKPSSWEVFVCRLGIECIDDTLCKPYLG